MTDTSTRLWAMLRTMVLSREFDSTAINLQRQGELALWPSSRGQEAIHAGAALAIGRDDVVFPTYREQGLLLARGVSPDSILALYRGTSLGAWDPATHNCFPTTLVIGAHTLHAVGYAMGLQRDAHRAGASSDPNRAVIAFLGDGAMSEGETNEAFVWASTQNAPVVFLCSNNGWAISAPTSIQTRVPFHKRAAGFGIQAVHVDGNDALAVYQATSSALEHAHAGNGPTFIEASTYRMNAHTTSDDDSRYRDSSEVETWTKLDPIDQLVGSLRESDADFEEKWAELEVECAQLASATREACRELPAPDPLEPFDFTLSARTAELDRQAFAYSQQPLLREHA